MSAATIACTACGRVIAADSKFCSVCGNPISRAPNATLMGQPIVRPDGPRASPTPSLAPKAPTPSLAPQAPIASQAPRGGSPHKTMLGMPNMIPPSAPVPSMSPASAATSAPVKGPQASAVDPRAPTAFVENPATLRGLSASLVGTTRAPIDPGPAEQLAQMAPPQASAAHPPPPNSPANYYSAPAFAPTQASSAHVPTPAPTPAPAAAGVEAQAFRVPVVDAASISGPSVGAIRQRAPVTYDDTESGSFDAIDGAPRARRPGGVLRALLWVTGGLILLGLGAIAAMQLMGASGVDVRVAVIGTDSGDALRIEVPEAPSGAKLRFGGVERALESGAATFPLSSESLTLGDNEIEVDLVDTAGKATQLRLTLTLKFRVRADLAALGGAEPAIDYIVDAPSDAEVFLDEVPLPLDANGHGVRRVPVPPGDAALAEIQRDARYRIVFADESRAEGVVRARAQVTTLQIDRPGASFVTDEATVEIAGAVDPGAVLTCDGAPISVREGRFFHRYALPAMGERQIRLEARAPDKAPRVALISVRRVADLRAEAATFGADAGITYARLAASPEVYRAQKMSFTGRVYEVAMLDGRSVIQMLVRDCPPRRRCPLWVSVPTATSATVESEVRVYGTGAGEQSFRTTGGEVVSVPRLDAVFVLGEPAAGRGPR